LVDERAEEIIADLKRIFVGEYRQALAGYLDRQADLYWNNDMKVQSAIYRSLADKVSEESWNPAG
jgi:hypothetical protein